MKYEGGPLAQNTQTSISKSKIRENFCCQPFVCLYMSRMIIFSSFLSRGCLPLPSDGPFPDKRPKADRLQEEDCRHLWDQTGQNLCKLVFLMRLPNLLNCTFKMPESISKLSVFLYLTDCSDISFRAARQFVDLRYLFRAARQLDTRNEPGSCARKSLIEYAR